MLWVTVANHTLDSIDINSGVVRAFPSLGADGADLASSPGDPASLFVAVDGLSPGAVYRLVIMNGVPTETVANGRTDQQNIQQIVVSPNGSRVIPASGAPYDFEELSSTTLKPDGVIYPGMPYPSAVAVAPGNGGVLATGLNDGYGQPDINVDPLGKPAAFSQFSTGVAGSTDNVLAHGLALSHDGRSLFAVTGAFGSRSSPTFWTFAVPAVSG